MGIHFFLYTKQNIVYFKLDNTHFIKGSELPGVVM